MTLKTKMSTYAMVQLEDLCFSCKVLEMLQVLHILVVKIRDETGLYQC